MAPIAYMAMFTGFRAYDDEGYFLIVLRDYLGGQALLNPAVPVYGPFFFETMGGLFKLSGLVPGQDSGRWVTLAIWLLASLLSGLAGYRLTGRLWLAAVAQLATFHILSALTIEPMSPAGLISLLVVGLMLAAAFQAARPRLAAVAIGAIVAALCLIKINVGGFAAIAVVFAWATGLEGRVRRSLVLSAGAVMTLLPIVLMSGLFSQAWVVEFAFGTALSGAAIGAVSLTAMPKLGRPPRAAWIAAGGSILAATCLAIALAGGTTLEDLWSGLILVSIRFPRIFTGPLPLNLAFDLCALASLGGALLFARRPAGSLFDRPASGWLRVALGAYAWLSVLFIPSWIFLIALPLAWTVLAVPPGADDPARGYARVLLPALAVLESLQAYPVAGTQLSIAALGLVPLGAIWLSDGIRQLSVENAVRPSHRRMARRIEPAIATIYLLVFVLVVYVTGTNFADSTPLGLPGAESVRLPPARAVELRALVSAIDRDCSSFFTYPGMNSLYVWTGQAPPTDVRSEIWMITYDSSQQQSLVSVLQSKPRLCVVKNQRQIEFWTRGSAVPSRPLVEFIDQGFIQAGAYGDYQLLERRPSS